MNEELSKSYSDSFKSLLALVELRCDQLEKMQQERDEWRKVADLLAADADEAAIGIGDSDALAKFRELDKKYPL